MRACALPLLLRPTAPPRIFAGRTSGAQDGPAPVRAGLQSLLLRPTARPLALGLVVAASLIAAETLVLYPLKGVAPANALGVVYLLGVLVVAIGWGFWLAAATSLASALAFDYFHIPPAFGFIPTYGADGVALGIFLVVALLAEARVVEALLDRGEVDGVRRHPGRTAARSLTATGVRPRRVRPRRESRRRESRRRERRSRDSRRSRP